MATASDTVKLSCQMTGMLGLGQSMSSALAAEGLGRLNQLLRQLFATGAWLDKRLDAAYEVGTSFPNQRFQCMSGCRTVTLPEMETSRMRDGLRVHVVDASRTAASSNITIARNGWAINGSAADATITTAGGDLLLMLDAASADWKKAQSLALVDSLPFAAEFDEDVALILARRWSGGRRFGQNLSDDEMGRAQDAWRRLRARYHKPPTLQQSAAVANINSGGGVSTGTGFDFTTGEDWA